MVILCTLVLSLSTSEAFGQYDENDFSEFQFINTEQTSQTEIMSQTGNFTHRYEVSLPSGVANLTPDLALIYNSSQRDEKGVLGAGWEVTIPYIETLNKLGSEKQFGSPQFFRSSFEGELIHSGGVNYEPKVTSVESNQYDFSNNQWIMTTSAGTKYYFGEGAASRQANPADEMKVKRWFVGKIEDTSGNIISYDYSQEQGQIYPSKISYGEYLVDFVYENTPRNISYANGFRTLTDQRISEITIHFGIEEIQHYQAEYNKNQLSSLTRYHPDTSAEVTTFEYTDNSDAGWVHDPRFYDDTIEQASNEQHADINGDGLIDRILAYDPYGDQRPYLEMRLNTGSDWEPYSQPWPTFRAYGRDYPMNITGEEPKIKLADFNGDGLVDLASHYQGFKVFMNTGSAWVHDPRFDVGLTAEYGMNQLLVDINADGLADRVYLRQDRSQNGVSAEVHTNTGSGWKFVNAAPDAWIFNDIPFALTGTDINSKLVDINGDGLLDIARSTANDVQYYLNTGKGWQFESFFTNYESYKSIAYQYADLNGDSLVEKIWAHKNFGNDRPRFSLHEFNAGWSSLGGLYKSSWPTYRAFGDDYPIPITGEDARIALSDINGDGIVDLVNTYQGFRVYMNTSKSANLLTQITYPSGAIETIEYTNPKIQSDTNKIPLPLTVVSSVTTDSGFGNSVVTSYAYEQAYFYYQSNDIRDRRFAGFGKVTKTTDLGTETTYYHQGNGDNLPMEAGDSEAKIGQKYLSETFSSN